jgi:hypothetical protein
MAAACWPTETFHRREGRNGNSGLFGRNIPQRTTDFCVGCRIFRGYQGRETRLLRTPWQTGIRTSQRAFPTLAKTESTLANLRMMDLSCDIGQQQLDNLLGPFTP